MNKLKFLLALALLNLPSLAYGQTWNKLGSGLCCTPLKFRAENGKLTMLGVLAFGGDTVNGVGFFDGNNTDSLRNIEGLLAYDYSELNNKKYVGGGFSYVGDWPFGYYATANIAEWDSANGWHSITPNYSPDFEIKAMQVYNGELYVAGLFTQINNTPNTRRIAKWNGTSWSSVGGGFIGQGEITCMAVYHGELYVGGQCGLPNGPNNFYNLVRWNGTQWDSVGGRFGPNYVTSLCVDSVNDILYIGGGISYAANVPVWAVAAWDGNTLSAPGIGITNGALAMTMFEGNLWVGGPKLPTDTITLAYWDGQVWNPILPCPNGEVTALADYQGNLYMGGDFTLINGNLPVNHIACYGNNCPATVGLNETQQPVFTFNIYPNPTHTQLTVETDEPKQHIVILRNGLGLELYRGSFTTKITLDLSAYAKGMVLAEVCTLDGKHCFSKYVILE